MGERERAVVGPLAVLRGRSISARSTFAEMESKNKGRSHAKTLVGLGTRVL